MRIQSNTNSSAEDAPRSVRQHLIDVADTLFYQQGIRAVGVDEVIRSAGIAKATLYRTFSGKQELVLAYLTQRSTFARARLVESGQGLPDAAARIVAAFHSLQTNLSNPRFRGCAFLLAVSEHGESTDIRELGIAHKTFVRSYFTALAEESGHPASLGEKLALIYEGALATAVVTPDSEPGRVALEVVEMLLAGTHAS